MDGNRFKNRTAPETDPIQQNIETVAKLESRYLNERTLSERLADGVANFTGSMTFVLMHAGGFVAYILWNLGKVRGLTPFDPYPFMLLSLIVSLEAIFLSTFVLMKENRISQRADQRAHLDLQINMLSEKEMTVMLQLLQ